LSFIFAHWPATVAYRYDGTSTYRYLGHFTSKELTTEKIVTIYTSVQHHE